MAACDMQPESITVFVNDKPKRAFLGMRVRNVLTARWLDAVRAHRAEIHDATGDRVDVDGALYDGEKLYVVQTTPRQFGADVLRRADG